MIDNNVAAQTAVFSLSKEEITEKISDLRDYGVEPSLIIDKLSTDVHEVAGALNNADTDEVLLELLRMNPDGILSGLVACAKILGLWRGTLYIPIDTPVDDLMASAHKIDFDLQVIQTEIVDVRKERNTAVFHLATLAAISDVLAGSHLSAPILLDGKWEEIPFGESIGTRITADNIKAVLIDHQFFPPSVLNQPLGFDFLPGSGTLRVVSNTECIVCAVKNELEKLRKKSCGKCTFCREGLFQMHTIISDYTENQSKKNDPELLEEISALIPANTNCSLGRMAASPVCSALKNFESEVTAHTKKKMCPAGQCKAFSTFYIDPSVCKGYGDCMDVCPKGCIEGKHGYISMIDEFDCTKCGKCVQVCTEGAIRSTNGRMPKLPTRLTRVGKFK